MTTISVDLSGRGLDTAVEQLESWAIGTFEPFAEYLTATVAWQIHDAVQGNIHIGDPNKQDRVNDYHEPGRLRESAKIDGFGLEYQVVVDAESGLGKHYAMIEQTRGGDHDFVHEALGDEKDGKYEGVKYMTEDAFKSMRDLL